MKIRDHAYKCWLVISAYYGLQLYPGGLTLLLIMVMTSKQPRALEICWSNTKQGDHRKRVAELEENAIVLTSSHYMPMLTCNKDHMRFTVGKS